MPPWDFSAVVGNSLQPHPKSHKQRLRRDTCTVVPSNDTPVNMIRGVILSSGVIIWGPWLKYKLFQNHYKNQCECFLETKQLQMWCNRKYHCRTIASLATPLQQDHDLCRSHGWSVFQMYKDSIFTKQVFQILQSCRVKIIQDISMSIDWIMKIKGWIDVRLEEDFYHWQIPFQRKVHCIVF